MSWKRRAATIGGAWFAVSVVASAAAARAIYTTIGQLQGEPDVRGLPEWEPETWHLALEKVPPETWRNGDVVRNRKTDEEVVVWGVSSCNELFMAIPYIGLLNTADYILVRIREEEK